MLAVNSVRLDRVDQIIETTQSVCTDLMTWLARSSLEVEYCHVSVLEADTKHVRVGGVDVETDDPVRGPALVLRVRGVLQGVDTHHSARGVGSEQV